MNYSVIVIFTVVFSLFCASEGYAYQSGRVKMSQAKVYSEPDLESSVLQELESGHLVWLSNESVPGQKGQRFFKIDLNNNAGGMGYILARAVEPGSVKREMQLAQLSQNVIKVDRTEPKLWTQSASLALIGSRMVSPGANGAGVDLSYFAAVGGLTRFGRFYAGTGFSMPGNGAMLLALGVSYRLFSDLSQKEPEMAIKFGYDVGLGMFATQFAIGYRIPLKLTYGPHWGLSLDLATHLGLSARDEYNAANIAAGQGSKKAPLLVLGSLGVGYYF